MPSPQLEQHLTTLPTAPGVYLMKDAQGEVLYVGKAKSLRARVRSYFRARADLDPAKQQMVGQVADIETIVCDTENEALILEANLIRQHQPPYNVVLTDDKYYLFIKITADAPPRIFPVRKLQRDKARYFGPYSSAASVRRTLKLLRRLFPFLDETTSPDEWNFPHPLFKQNSAADYEQNISQIIRFLKGDRAEIIKTLRAGMRTAARERNFEQAALWRDQLHAIERLEGNQKVFLPRKESFDVISIASDGNRSAANVFAVRGGKLLNKHTFLLRHRGAAAEADVLRQFLLQYYRDAQDIPGTILVPATLPDTDSLRSWINDDQPPILVVPQRGHKRQLLEMGVLNAQQLLQQESAAFEQEGRLKKATEELAHYLQLPASPAGHSPLRRVETYDISNIQGKNATGSMVVFTDGLPDRAQYRSFRIATKDTPDDFSMLREVLSRRFSGRHPDWKLPDLVLIDGGKGQLSAVGKVFKELGVTVPLASLAKREEELFVPGQSAPIRLPYDSDALYLVQRMRDEAHRTGVSYHRLLRSKQSKRSLLDEIPGIGPKTKKQLLNHFGSLKKIRAATEEELRAVIGNRAKLLRDYL